MTKQKNVEKWKLLRTCKHFLIVAKPIVSSLNWDVPSSLWEMKITITCITQISGQGAARIAAEPAKNELQNYSISCNPTKRWWKPAKFHEQHRRFKSFQLSILRFAIPTIANRCVEGMEKWWSIHPGGKWIMGPIWELQNGMVSY